MRAHGGCRVHGGPAISSSTHSLTASELLPLLHKSLGSHGNFLVFHGNTYGIRLNRKNSLRTEHADIITVRNSDFFQGNYECFLHKKI